MYLKDYTQLQNYLLELAVENAIVEADGVQYAGYDLKDILQKALAFYNSITTHKSLDRTISEVIVMAGYTNTCDLEAFAKRAVGMLQSHADHQDLWSYSVDQDERSLALIHEHKGVVDKYFIHEHSFSDYELNKFSKLYQEIKPIFGTRIKVNSGSEERYFLSPCEFIEYMMNVSKQSVYVQRFKGLGEMNADQLWDTTLNPETRTLLQVKVNDSDEANQLFSVLMGDVVEPRREFIQENALKVENLDT